MKPQIYWEDIKPNDAITPLAKIATTQMLVQWAGASGDFNPLHFEAAFAEAQGVGKPIVTGQLKRAWLVQLVSDWAGECGMIRKFSCQFRGMDTPRPMKTVEEPQEGETWYCKGTVTKTYAEGDNHFADCDIWVENGKGEKTTNGSATVLLPCRTGAK